MKESENLFLGYTIEYWIELQRKAEELKVTDLIEEIAQLRGKVSFYESRITQMHDFLKFKSNPL